MSERYVGQLHSADDLIAAVEEYGFLPFFQNEIPGFSVEELCAPELWFVRKTLWLGCGRICDAGRAFRVRLYHLRLSARPAGIQRAHSKTSAITSA